MDRYFDHKSPTVETIVLPEYIPLERDSSHRTNSQSETDTSIPISATSLRRRATTSSPANRTPERRSSQQQSSADRNNRNENGHRRTPPRDSSYRERHYSPIYHQTEQQPRSRSRSPRSSHSEVTSHQRRDQSYQRIEYRRSTERLSSERLRSAGSSVFDRMTNPPAMRRRYAEHSGSRQCADSNVTQIVRTVSNQLDPIYRSTEQALGEVVPYVRQRSPAHEQIRFTERYTVESNHIPEIPFSSRSVLLDENPELLDLKNRLIAAQNHCNGLEDTVIYYQREIHKLRRIINDIVTDYNSLSFNRR